MNKSKMQSSSRQFMPSSGLSKGGEPYLNISHDTMILIKLHLGSVLPVCSRLQEAVVRVTHVAVASGSGIRSGMQNQKMEPVFSFERTPTLPPRTLTCLLQMLKPRPVPPRLRGLLISSSVP